MTPDRRSELRKAWAAILAAGAMLAVFHAIGAVETDGHALGLGSLNEPTPRHGRFLALWTVYGTAAAVFLCLGCYRLLPAGLGDRLGAAWRASSDKKWMVYGALVAFLIAAVVRKFLLLEMPLTDDEAAYRLAAEILARGRLYLDSPPAKLFFDNRFLVNDGKLYALYFLGWPALLVPGVWIGLPGFMNALYSALTVPALFLVTRRLAGGTWARAAVVLYLSSPMLAVGAATMMSHASCLMALAYFTWFYLRSRDGDAAPWHSSAMAFFFSLAFFIRPLTALGYGAPLLVAWLWELRSLDRSRRWRRLAAMAGPAVVMAALFLTVNKVQNGSLFTVGYQRGYTYAAENAFRFSHWTAKEAASAPRFELRSPLGSLASAGSGLFRFNYALLGWPCSLLFAFLARGREARLLWATLFSFLAVHVLSSFTPSVGVDTFGPTHYYELALPALVLSALGLERLRRSMGSLEPRLAGVPVLAAAAAVAVSLAGYVPVRFAEAHGIAASVRAPWRTIAEEGLERAVIFAPDPFIHPCSQRRSRGWVFVRPNNDPDLANDPLWVNHLTVADDQAFMTRFPQRRGYVMVWLASCEPAFLPLDELAPGMVPDSRYVKPAGT